MIFSVDNEGRYYLFDEKTGKMRPMTVAQVWLERARHLYLPSSLPDPVPDP